MDDYLGQIIPKLGFGLMRLEQKDGKVDMVLAQELIDTYMENGFTYFDTAYVYLNRQSESVAGELLVKRYPRETFQLATKMPMWMVQKPEDLERIFHEQLEHTGAGYFDFYLLHGVNGTVSDRFPSSNIQKTLDFGAWEFLKKMKEAGKIRHIGFSFHDTANVLEDLLLHQFPEAEFVQLQLNYADWEDPVIQSRKCYEVALKYNRPIIIMEPIKGGTLTQLRPEVAKILKEKSPDMSLAAWAIRFAAGLDGVITVLSGMSSMEQLTDNLSYMNNFRPLDKAETDTLKRAALKLQEIETIGCTACKYCMDSCPQSIPIPAVFALANDYRIYRDKAYSQRRYANTVKKSGKASDCISCGLCESHCPQKLPVIELLADTATALEYL